MTQIAYGVRGLGLLARLNLDRALYIGAIFAALMLGAYIGAH